MVGAIHFREQPRGGRTPQALRHKRDDLEQRWQGSNLKPRGSEPRALPIELHRYGQLLGDNYQTRNARTQ